jgi:hypothetical protein
VAGPGGFTYAFAKLEQAIEHLVGAGDIKTRMEAAAMVLAPIFPDDFPEGRMRDEYASIREALTWVSPEEGSTHGLLGSTLEVMAEEEAASLAKRLFFLYLDAVESRRGH